MGPSKDMEGSKVDATNDDDKKKSGVRLSGNSGDGKSSGRESGSILSIQQRLQQASVRKPSRQKSIVVEELPPCQIYRTRSSLDYLANPIDQPRTPRKYLPPFRRNFRYFGYPKDLNLDINTPPRVKSWGSIPENLPKSNKHKRQGAYGYRLTLDDSFDPHWMGRLLKRNLLLENPGLLPAADKAAIALGNKDKLKLIHPELEVHNCPSDLFFPVTERSRKAFCRINKTVQDITDRQKHAYTVKNATVAKFAATEQVMLKNERDRQPKQTETPKNQQNSQKRKSLQLSLIDGNSDEQYLNYYDPKAALSPVINTMCVKDAYPGLNQQVYQRPAEDDDGKDLGVKTYDDILRYGEPIIPDFAMNVPDDVWHKLSKVRTRQQQMDKNSKGRSEVQDPDQGKFRTFTQIQLRDEVLRIARNDFMETLKEDLNAPLPEELFKDNREMFEPYHDYYDKGELPAQGPFGWKTPREEPPSEEELLIVDKFIQEAKMQHNFTHHLPGLSYAPRHPLPPFELDWFEKGSKIKSDPERRKTPSELFEMPAYLMNLDKDKFEEKFSQTIKEGAKDLVGPEIYDLYKRTYGIMDAEQKESTDKINETSVPVIRKRVRRRRQTQPKEVVEEEEDGEEEDEKEEEAEEEMNDEEDDEEEGASDFLIQFEEIEPEYKLSKDLLEEQHLPLPDTRFSLIDFPKDQISESLKEDMKYFKRYIENATVVRSELEEATDFDDSDTADSQSDEQQKLDFLPPKFSHDAVSHLQTMYQDAMKSKHKSFHRPIKNQDMEPPNLKDIFLMETYFEDIDKLLYHNENIPKFLELF